MDPLSDILSLLHLEHAVARRMEAGGQWGLHSSMHKHIVLGAVLNGSCWLHVEHLARPLQLSPGDCYLVTNGSTFHIGSDLTIEAIDFDKIDINAVPSVMRLGNGAETCLIGARFTFDELYGKALLSFLPPAIYVPSASVSAGSLKAILHRLGEELQNPGLGSDLVVNHLALIALVQAIRASLACEERPCTGWLGALADNKISESISLMHGEVTRRWTLAELASAVGMSRSSFADRFKTLVGLPPLEYLLRWRMHLASRMLRGGNRPISLIASDLGYASESAFSNAFKRVIGCSPKAYRTLERTTRGDGQEGRLPRDPFGFKLDASAEPALSGACYPTDGVEPQLDAAISFGYGRTSGDS